MKGWQEERIQALLSIPCERKLFDAMAGAVRELGFEHCAYGLRAPLPISRPRLAMVSDYPDGWQARYRERNYVAIDPTVRHCTRSRSPVIWSDTVFSEAREMWDEARSFGLRTGWAQSSCDRHGAGIGGMLTVTRSDEELTDKEIRAKADKLTWLTHVVHLGMSRRLMPKLLPETGARLTGRETAVLRWTAEGKTAAEVSQILRISERTVHFHIGNAVEKLGVTNKLAAAVKAAVLGMLY